METYKVKITYETLEGISQEIEQDVNYEIQEYYYEDEEVETNVCFPSYLYLNGTQFKLIRKRAYSAFYKETPYLIPGVQDINTNLYEIINKLDRLLAVTKTNERFFGALEKNLEGKE